MDGKLQEPRRLFHYGRWLFDFKYHVVKDAAKVRLLTSAGLIDAKVVQVDAANDLALLKADGFAPLPIVPVARGFWAARWLRSVFPTSVFAGVRARKSDRWRVAGDVISRHVSLVTRHTSGVAGDPASLSRQSPASAGCSLQRNPLHFPLHFPLVRRPAAAHIPNIDLA